MLVRVRPETHEVLRRLKLFLSEQEGVEHTYDDVINWLFMVAKPHREDFPHWPVFREADDLERRRRRFWREFRSLRRPSA